MEIGGVYGFYKDGASKITYNQFDSHPSCLGLNILAQARCFTVKKMDNAFKKIVLVDENDTPTNDEIKKYKNCTNTSVCGEFSNKIVCTYYQLLRNIQGSLEPYLTGTVNLMIDSEEFIKNSLYCEWGYIINLDNQTLEVWRGLQKQPRNNRYKLSKEETENYKPYYNCRLIETFPLNNLPSDNEFLDILAKLE